MRIRFPETTVDYRFPCLRAVFGGGREGGEEREGEGLHGGLGEGCVEGNVEGDGGRMDELGQSVAIEYQEKEREEEREERRGKG